MIEPCLCGAPDCRRCFPSTWWHDMDNCTGDGECDCVDPHDYDIDYDLDWGDDG